MYRANPGPIPPASEIEYIKDITMRDGHVNEIRVHKPPGSATAGFSTLIPLVVLIHGGGFCMGNPSTLSLFARAIASLHGATVVNPAYRLAPEFKFPTAPNDIWDTVTWLARPENAQEIGADLSLGFFIGGCSAGANLAAVTVQQWVTQGLSPPVTGMWLGIPVVLSEDTVPADLKHLWFSRSQHADALILNKAAIDDIAELYQYDVTSTSFTPFTVKDPHRNMPPTYIQVNGQDPLRDDGLIYERVLRENGVMTRMDVYPGLPHGFAESYPDLNVSKRNRVDTMKGFGWLFHVEHDETVLENVLEKSVDT